MIHYTLKYSCQHRKCHYVEMELLELDNEMSQHYFSITLDKSTSDISESVGVDRA